MKAKGYRSAGMVLAVAALLSAATYAERGDGVRLPAAVRKALQSLYPGATPEEVKSEMEGMRVYEVELEQGERDVALTVAPDGTVLEVETQVALEELPDPVKAALRRAAGGAEIEEISKEVTHWVLTLKKLDAPEVSYEAQVVKDGREIELEFAADGALLPNDDDGDEDEDEDEGEDDERVSLDDVPRAVRATIQKHAKGAEIEEIERETENGETVYEVVVELRISPEGKVLGPEEDDDDADANDDEDEDEDEDEERVSLDDVPGAVRATIQKRARGAEIEEIERETEDGKAIYEVVIELRISPDGKVLGPEENDDDDKGDEDEDEDEDEERVSLDDVPKAVRAVILRYAKRAEIEEIERETESGKTVYEAAIELRISAGGRVLGPEKDDDD